MSFNGLGKKCKRILAFLLAAALFFNAWIDYGFSVLAEGEVEDTTPTTEWSVELSSLKEEYTGNDLKPTVTVNVEEGTEYTVDWRDSEGNTVDNLINVGTYTAKVTINENNDYKEAEFKVEPFNLTNCDITVDSSVSFVYSGTEINPGKEKITLKKGENTVPTDWYKLVVTPAKNAGEEVIINVISEDGNTNITGQKSKNFVIDEKPLTEEMINVTGIEDSYIYNGSLHQPQVTVEVEGNTWVKDNDYRVSYGENITDTTGGSVTVTTLESGSNSKNYTSANKTINFSIVRPAIEDAVVIPTGEQHEERIDNWYATSVKLNAEGYLISTDESGVWGDELKITNYNDGEIKYYLKDTNGGISEAKNVTIYVDMMDPVFANIEGPSTDWAQEKTVKFKVTEDNLQKVTYTLEGNSEQTVSPDENGIYTITVTDEIVEGSKTLIIKAIDKAGRVASIEKNIEKIDPTAPTFATGFDGGSKWTNAKITVDLGIHDNVDTDVNVSVTPEKGAEITTENGNYLVTFSPETEGEKTYTFTAKDDVGNECTATYTVKVDQQAPELEILTNQLIDKKDDKAPYYSDEEGVYWFANPNVTLPVKVTDGEEGKSAPYTVLLADNENMKNPKKSYTTSGTREISDEFGVDLNANLNADGKNVYYFQVIDEAGNASEVKSITLGYDGEAATITGVSVEGISNDTADHWVNGTESSDGSLEFTINVTESKTPIKKIEYKVNDLDYTEVSNVTPVDGGYKFTTTPVADKKGYNYSVRLTNQVDQEYIFENVVVNLDRSAPEEEAYICFISDTLGDNNVTVNGEGEAEGTYDEETKTWTSKMMEVASGTWNKIWGKTTIKFEVYVFDEVSGIADVVLTCEEGKINYIRKTEGLTTRIEGKEYTIYEGTITCKEADVPYLEEADFTITSVTDAAGNVRENLVLKNTDGSSLIYLDSVAPKLKVSAEHVEITNGNFAEGATYFTNADNASVTLIMEERFFEEKSKPTIILEKKGAADSSWTTESEITDWTSIGNYQWTCKINLVKTTGEIEYRLRIEKYADPSGNIMVDYADDNIVTNVTEDGSYISSTFVVDAVAPMLTYSVSGSANCSFVDRSTVYKNEGNSDLKVTVTIDDTPQYFKKDNLKVSMVSISDEEMGYFTISDITPVGNAHTYEFNCEEKVADNREFYVKIEYMDQAGNVLIANENKAKPLEEGKTVVNGIYESQMYIIDNVASTLNVSYDNVSRIVKKDGTAWEDGGEDVRPQSGYDAYFKDGIKVTFTVDEKFTNSLNNAPEHHKLQVYKNGSDEPVYSSVVGMNDEADESISGIDVTWTNTGDTYTAVVEIPKDSTAHATDGEYQIVFANEDCAGNKMKVADTADDTVSGLLVDGTYTSPKLILDTKAPETDAHIQFISDVKGDNENFTKNTSSEKFESAILSMKDNNWKEIWANKNLEFKVYVRDTYSGVKEIQENDSIQMSYTNGSETVVLDLIEAEEKANVSTDDPNMYTVYTGKLEIDEDIELKISDFRIDWIKDVAGNEMSTPITLNGRICLDDVTPKLEVGYNDAYQIMNVGSWESGASKVPQKDYIAFYQEDIKATFVVTENSTKATSENALEHHKLIVTKDGNEVYTSEIGMNSEVSSVAEGNTNNGINVRWSKNDSNQENVTYTAEVTIQATSDHTTDGDYQITFATKDCTGNLMEAKDADAATVKGLISDDGSYTSPLLVIDTTAPQLSYSYVVDGNPIAPATLVSHKNNGRYYFKNDDIKENINLKIEICDKNIRYKELNDSLKSMAAKKANGEDIDNINSASYQNSLGNIGNTGVRNSAESWNTNISLTTDANYTIPISFCDLAGNPAVITTAEGQKVDENSVIEYVTVDQEAPKFTYQVVGQLDDGGKDDDGNSKGVNYTREGTFGEQLEKFIGFFFKDKGVKIVITVTDEISGAYGFKYSGGMSGEKNANSPATTFSGEISVGKIKEQIVVTAYDYSQNDSSQTVGAFIVETQTGEITFDDTATPASREVGNKKYYNKDVDMRVTFNEKDAGESGIDKLEVKYDETTAATEEYKGKGGQITYELTTNKPITTTEFNKNNIIVSASMTDNAGNVSEKEHETIYNIDVTAPTIKVTYDNNEPYNENYYNKVRVATVEITERNFDENDVVWLITSTDGPEPIISGWSHSGEDDDSNVHTCTVTFGEDSDYTFSLEFEDMAGNKADYSKVDEFTIDKTLPVMEVTYNNNEFLNEYYYNSSRTATIDILEHNFDPNGIQINVTADNAAGGASISGWTRNGDHNIATVAFVNDAEYTLDIEGVDLANNELEDYEMDHFVVDQTVPELEIYDIENLSANKGEVRPGIRYFDTNYDAEGTVVIFKGYHNGEQEMEGDKSLQVNGLELKLHDIPHIQENDDVYTMEATVYDLAGNSSEASVMFSVNRFGSVYTFDEATKALVGEGGKYYTNEEQDIVIVETNVDTLEFKEITCNLNGKLSTLKEGEDFDVYLDGTEATWKQYTYRIFKENFEEEGTYIITTYSEDKATNTSDNNSKGKSVEFVVDKTNPSVIISGVEDGGQYREDKHEMTVDIEDNVRVAEMIVNINGVETRFNTAEINEVDGKITMDIESENQWQAIKVTVVDAAGNETVADELKVLVTANLFVQFVSNRIMLCSTLGVVGTGTAAWWFILRKRKIMGAK